MAKRMLFSMVSRGIANSMESRVVSSPLFGRTSKFSTKDTGDSETHADFRPASKLEGSSISAQDVVREDVKINPVMIYMKGVPDAPRCGFSALAVKVLQLYGVPLSSRNILEDPILKEGVKAFSNWPTFPQIFVKGEFIGGSDIVLSMHQSGQLKELLSGVNGSSIPSADS